MKKTSNMPTLPANRPIRGFTLMETVIAIGVLAVLLTGFIAVFTPAAQGIRRSISAQQADRLATSLESELATLRSGQNNGGATTGFAKAYEWIKNGNTVGEAIFVYQYRGNPNDLRTDDGTPRPVTTISGQPGVDYVIYSMARRASEIGASGNGKLGEDLKAIEGTIFYVRPTQLVLSGSQMIASTNLNQITHLVGTAQTDSPSAATYNEAVIAFSAEFYSIPSKSSNYLTSDAFKGANGRFATAKRPVFTRNLAVRR